MFQTTKPTYLYGPQKNNNDLHHHLVKGAQNEAIFLKLGQHVHQLELGILRHRKIA